MKSSITFMSLTRSQLLFPHSSLLCAYSARRLSHFTPTVVLHLLSHYIFHSECKFGSFELFFYSNHEAFPIEYDPKVKEGEELLARLLGRFNLTESL